MLSSFAFLMRESLRGWVRHRKVLVPTLVTVLLCALLLQAALWAIFSAWHLSPAGEDDWKVSVFLAETHESTAARDTIERQLYLVSGVQQVLYVDREEAARRFRREFGQAFLDLSGGNPLPLSFEVVPSQADRTPARLALLLARFRQLPGVEEATAPVEGLRQLEEWRDRILSVLIGFGLVLLFVLRLVLRNAVHLGLYSRKILIENMQILGANPRFIAFPFVVESLSVGLLGGAGGWAAWEAALEFLRTLMPGWSASLQGAGWAAAALTAGIALFSGWSAFGAVRGHLAGEREE